MRFHGVLAEVAGSPAKAKLLDVFLRFPARTFTGRSAAREAGVSQPAGLRALKALVQVGVVSGFPVGPSVAYRLSAKHYLSDRLKLASGLDHAVFRELKEIVTRHARRAGVTRAVLFGSRARGDERPDSDIDVFVIVPTARLKAAASSAMHDATFEAMERFGDPISPIVHSEREIQSGSAKDLAKTVKTEGIVLFETNLKKEKTPARQRFS